MSITDVPHPSLEQVIVGAEMLILLWPVRVVARRIEKEADKTRAHIIHAHVKNRHQTKLQHCTTDQCQEL